MFIRVKSTPNSPRKSVQLVESYRNNKGLVRQRIVRHIGVAMDKAELQQLMGLAELVKAKTEHERHPGLFAPDFLAQMAMVARDCQPKKCLRVDLGNLREVQRVCTGLHGVFGRLYEELGFERIFVRPSQKKVTRRNLRHVVLARLADPQSKRASVDILAKQFGVQLSLPSVYRMMDALDEAAIAAIKRSSYEAASTLLGGPVSVVFYDCTTLYFESFEEDELRQKGFSKDAKTQETQVLLALLCSPEGLPMGYEVFPGSTWEGHTLQNALETLRQTYKLEELTMVADAGLLSNKNRHLFDYKAKQYYILGARLKNMAEKVQGNILNPQGYQEASHQEEGYKIKEMALEDGSRLILSYSPKRARKDQADRKKAIEKLRKKLEKSDKPAQHLSQRGHARYLKIEGQSRIQLDEEKLIQAARWDGLHGVISNHPKLSPSELLHQYHQLWKIEESFRISKHDLKIRPIYHWTPPRIRAHIAICYIALVCMRHLTHRVKLQHKAHSPESIRRHLGAVQTSIVRDQKTGKEYAIPSNLSPVAEKLLRIMGQKHDRRPYEINK